MASFDGLDPADVRFDKWEQALNSGKLPDFVVARLEKAKTGAVPWLSTMTPAELLLARSHGIKPLATVSGTCWYHYGWSWTEGHAEGWNIALTRLRQEAVACGANAVVDVHMRTIARGENDSMDFTLVGTAVRFASLPAAKDPIVATVPALEFVRLLEIGIVPTGLAVGAKYDWLQQSSFRPDYSTGGYSGYNTPLTDLGKFWERVRRQAHAELRANAARQGNGVLADVHFGQLLRYEGGENQPMRYLGRHIVIGTVVDTPRKADVPHHIRTVVDMRDTLSPLRRKIASRHGFGTNDSEGGI
ncbi:heavy metal-binding domain-containing protein [Labrys okinawensis]|uniref:heavy metal-binding domain-containing protein n=1 Tax=Labrys okinawensis TaxID=346911 RepID=UPI0039BCF989